MIYNPPLLSTFQNSTELHERTTLINLLMDSIKWQCLYPLEVFIHMLHVVEKKEKDIVYLKSV